MKFDFAIGNPPFQIEAPGESTSDKPVYHLFIDESYKISNVVELITPARFLFNAGSTPKKWNKKMLNDKHIKVLFYKANAKEVFPNTAITGGLAVTYRNVKKGFQPIKVYVPFPELNRIREKVLDFPGFCNLSSIISGRTPYLFTDTLHEENPTALAKLSEGHKYDISSNAFTSLPKVFIDTKPDKYIDFYRVLGRKDGRRTYKWIMKKYARGRTKNLINKWKVFLPKANGASGMLGKESARLISKPELGEPNDIATDTFICVGSFKNKVEACSALKYILSKFARALLGTLKVTQINSKETWNNVPLQDFTDKSDIDWSKSVADIDKQLYKKYKLSQEEISFIETHVKEMA